MTTTMFSACFHGGHNGGGGKEEEGAPQQEEDNQAPAASDQSRTSDADKAVMCSNYRKNAARGRGRGRGRGRPKSTPNPEDAERYAPRPLTDNYYRYEEAAPTLENTGEDGAPQDGDRAVNVADESADVEEGEEEEEEEEEEEGEEDEEDEYDQSLFLRPSKLGDELLATEVTSHVRMIAAPDLGPGRDERKKHDPSSAAMKQNPQHDAKQNPQQDANSADFQLQPNPPPLADADDVLNMLVPESRESLGRTLVLDPRADKPAKFKDTHDNQLLEQLLSGKREVTRDPDAMDRQLDELLGLQ